MEKMENDRLDAVLRSSARVLAEDNAEILVGTWREIPPKTDRHIRRTIRQSRRMREYGALYRRGRQIAAVFCVVCAAVLLLALSVQAARDALWSVLVHWYDKYVAVTYTVSDQVPAAILEKREPTVPADWEKRITLDTEFVYAVRYYQNNEQVFQYRQEVVGDKESWYDNSDAVVEEIEIHGMAGAIVTMQEENCVYLIWSDGTYLYTVSDRTGTTPDLVIRMAELIR